MTCVVQRLCNCLGLTSGKFYIEREREGEREGERDFGFFVKLFE
jgi:hypothetical protein